MELRTGWILLSALQHKMQKPKKGGIREDVGESGTLIHCSGNDKVTWAVRKTIG